MQALLIYVPCANIDEAKTIARELINSKLAACANIIPQIYSIYNWESKICEDNETLLLLKSAKHLYEKLVTMIKANHSYACPCIASIPFENCNSDYLYWLTTNLEPETL
ncbi:MAG: divalent-cation tolerance protein CutA [Candidatus Caenarcaniphilales bacterium]|jgi:periplasmic divalent cation tolerance protein|nr:divalent-cation tolerance protein CutA [Candidatus Caenarcaniphilales bacterium]